MDDYYLNHLLPVAELVDEAYYNIALGHDLFEDTDATTDELREVGFNSFEITVIQKLTKEPNETYDQYIERFTSEFSGQVCGPDGEYQEPAQDC